MIPDEIDAIARTVRDFSGAFDYVFTSGGIGPTHDDVTIEGISEAFGVSPVIDERLRLILLTMYKELTPERLRMAEVPEGAELVNDGSLTLPAIRYKNVYVLPGIPELLTKKFMTIAKPLGGTPPFLKKACLTEHETEIARTLAEIVRTHREVKIGSYPVMGNSARAALVVLLVDALSEFHAPLAAVAQSVGVGCVRDHFICSRLDPILVHRSSS